MDANTKKDGSAGRARGHSMLSALKIIGNVQVHEEESQQDHPGISFQRLRQGQGGAAGIRPSMASTAGRVVSATHVSALTMALKEAGVGTVAVSTAVPIKISGSVPGDATPPGLSSDDDDDCENEDMPEFMVEYEKPDLRQWCSGQPSRKSYLSSARSVPRIRFSRRSTLANKPELDHLLAATKVEYNGHFYLPLTAKTIHRLDPLFKGAKPLADMKLFKCIIINKEINGVHADHVVAALEFIGEHCEHLLVMSPVQTSELGNVFKRESDNINTGNDWDAILGCFPNLKHLAFVHRIGERVGFSRSTFHGLRAAVARRQATKEEFEGVSFSVPAGLLM